MRPAVLPVVSSIVALTAIAVWERGDYLAQRGEHIEEERRHGEVVLAAVEGLTAREFRGGRYVPESLTAAMSEALRVFDVEWISIAEPGGEILVTVGEQQPTLRDVLHFEAQVEPLRPRHPEGRPWGDHPGTLTLTGTPLSLGLVLSSASLDVRLAKDRARFALTTSALALAILLFGGVFWLRMRALELRGALESGRRELENLERLRRVGAGLVHETKNPMSVVRGLAERIMRRGLDSAEVQATARAIVDETDRTVARLDEFLLYSRPAAVRRAPVAVDLLFEELAALIEPELESIGANIVIDCSGTEIHADREQLRRLFLNLLLNATQAISSGSRIELSCRRDGDVLSLAVEDDGPGVPVSLRETLFEPYVSMREGGAGLGLAIARRIATDHGFHLRYEPREPRGTRMVLEVRSQ